MNRTLKFGDFSLHGAILELRRGATRLHVQPKVLHVLYELAASSGRTVSSEELLRTVWREETVTTGSIKRAIRSARMVLGDDGASQRSIRTVRGQGYRFILRVTAMDEDALAPDDSRPSPSARLA
jgi:DNA-binding winged helix-turn-helix (wHTH) protein